MTNKFCDDALNEENSSDDRTELDKNLEKIVEAINIALKAIIPNLSIELVKTNEEKNKDPRYYDLYSPISHHDESRGATGSGL